MTVKLKHNLKNKLVLIMDVHLVGVRYAANNINTTKHSCITPTITFNYIVLSS